MKIDSKRISEILRELIISSNLEYELSGLIEPVVDSLYEFIHGHADPLDEQYCFSKITRDGVHELFVEVGVFRITIIPVSGGLGLNISALSHCKLGLPEMGDGLLSVGVKDFDNSSQCWGSMYCLLKGAIEGFQQNENNRLSAKSLELEEAFLARSDGVVVGVGGLSFGAYGLGSAYDNNGQSHNVSLHEAKLLAKRFSNEKGIKFEVLRCPGFDGRKFYELSIEYCLVPDISPVSFSGGLRAYSLVVNGKAVVLSVERFVSLGEGFRVLQLRDVGTLEVCDSKSDSLYLEYIAGYMNRNRDDGFNKK